MAASLSVRRQVADPNISIRDLMQAFQNHVVQCNNYDFLELVNCPGHCKWSWKTSPHPSWMCKIHRLVGSLLGVAPNGVLPSAKVRQSLMKLAELMKINQTRSNTSDFADKCDERIRIVMSQYRLVKNNPYEYQRLMKKATPEEKLCIDRTLSLLSVDAAPSSTTIDEIGGSSQLAMVPYVPGKVGSLPSSPKKNIFRKILSKQDSSPDQKKQLQYSHGLLPKSVGHGPGAQDTDSGKLQRKNAFLFPGEAGFCVPGDDTISENSKPSPVKKKKRHSTGNKSSSSQKEQKNISNVCKEVLSDDDLEVVEEALSSQIPAHKKPAAAKAVTKKKEKKSKTSKKPAGQGKNKTKAKTSNSSGKKTSFRHRATSSAYHQAKTRALQQGESAENARAAGRTASRKLGEEIDAGLVKDPDAPLEA